MGGKAGKPDPLLSEMEMSDEQEAKEYKRKTEVAKAAWQLEDVMNEKFVDRYPDKLEARQMQINVQHAEVWSSRATIGMVLLSVFETPSWCRAMDNFFAWDDSRCTVDGVDSDMVLLSQIPYLPPGWSLMIECVLIWFIFRHLWLRKLVQEQFFDFIEPDEGAGEENGAVSKPGSFCTRLCTCFCKAPVQNNRLVYYPHSHFKFGIACMVLEFLDVLIFFNFPMKSRYAVISRTGILCLSPAVQKLAETVSKVINEYISVAVFFIGFVVFFAWITVTIFDDLGAPYNGVERPNKGFDKMSSALNSFWIAGICEDFVQVFMKSYTAYRSSGLLWLLFLVIAHLLLLSLVLDTLCAAYRSKTEKDEETKGTEEEKGVNKAFKSLARGTNEDGGEETVTQDAFRQFVIEFGRSPSIPTISEAHADIIFRAVDADRGGTISEDEFGQISRVIQYQFWTTTKDSTLATWAPNFWKSKAMTSFRKFVERDGGLNSFEFVMNCILTVNFVLVITETNWDLNNPPCDDARPTVPPCISKDEPAWMENLEFAFSFVYLGEISCRLAVISFEEYRSSRANMFDFFTTWLLLFSAILEKFAKSSLATYANMLRLLRLLRMVKAIKSIESVQFMIDTIAKLVQRSQDIVTLLFVVLFFFTTLSVQVFGGELYSGNEHIAETEYVEKNMFVFNFNDWPSAFGVWMVMLLSEYKPEFPDVCFAATREMHHSYVLPHSWVMFPVFYVIGGSIIFELVKAFTIEVFMELKSEWERKKQGGGGEEELECLRKVKRDFKEIGLELHYKQISNVMLRAREKGGEGEE